MTRNRLSALLEYGALSTRVQAIVHVANDLAGASLIGVECLARGPAGTPFQRPDVLFDYVRRKHAEVIFDRECIGVALRTLRSLPRRTRVFLNVHASTLGRDKWFINFLEHQAEMAEVDLDHLTLELVEHAGPWDHAAFLSNVRELKQRGVSIALDDLGVGHSNYRMVLDVHPAYLKLDPYLIRGCNSDPARSAILRSIVQLASDTGAIVIGEGVEEVEDWHGASAAGIRHLQGFFFHRPSLLSDFLQTSWVCNAPETQGTPASEYACDMVHRPSPASL